MNDTKRIVWTCPQCQGATEVEVTFPTPAQTYGPPEKRSPAADGEINPKECARCAFPIDCHDAVAQATTELQAAKEYAAEAGANPQSEEP
jgi:hypothetical protein